MKMELKSQVEPCSSTWNADASRRFTKISLSTTIVSSLGLAVGSVVNSQTLMAVSIGILVLAFCMILSTVFCIYTRRIDFPGCFVPDCEKDHNSGTLRNHKDSLVKLFVGLALIIPVNAIVVATLADEGTFSQIVSAQEVQGNENNAENSSEAPTTEVNEDSEDKDSQDTEKEQERYEGKQEIKERMASLGYR